MSWLDRLTRGQQRLLVAAAAALIVAAAAGLLTRATTPTAPSHGEPRPAGAAPAAAAPPTANTPPATAGEPADETFRLARWAAGWYQADVRCPGLPGPVGYRVEHVQQLETQPARWLIVGRITDADRRSHLVDVIAAVDGQHIAPVEHSCSPP